MRRCITRFSVCIAADMLIASPLRLPGAGSGALTTKLLIKKIMRSCACLLLSAAEDSFEEAAMPFAPAGPLPAPAAPFDNAGLLGRWVIGFVPEDQALGAGAFLR